MLVRLFCLRLTFNPLFLGMHCPAAGLLRMAARILHTSRSPPALKDTARVSTSNCSIPQKIHISRDGSQIGTQRPACLAYLVLWPPMAQDLEGPRNIGTLWRHVKGASSDSCEGTLKRRALTSPIEEVLGCGARHLA